MFIQGAHSWGPLAVSIQADHSRCPFEVIIRSAHYRGSFEVSIQDAHPRCIAHSRCPYNYAALSSWPFDISNRDPQPRCSSQRLLDRLGGRITSELHLFIQHEPSRVPVEHLPVCCRRLKVDDVGVQSHEAPGIVRVAAHHPVPAVEPRLLEEDLDGQLFVLVDWTTVECCGQSPEDPVEDAPSIRRVQELQSFAVDRGCNVDVKTIFVSNNE